MPLVSIVTASYNASRTIEETARSVFAQTFSDWEWIIVDDASSDGTRAVLRRLAEGERRLRLGENNHNMGPASTRRKAMEMARGCFIAFLDSDDLWLPEKLAHQLAFMKDKNAAFSYTALRRMDEDGKRVGRGIHVPGLLDYDAFLKNTAMATSSVMIDATLIHEMSMADVSYEDFAAWLSILKRGHVAYGLDEDLLRYRVRKNSLSANKLRAIGKVWQVYREVEGLGLSKSIWCLANYGWHAALKRMGT